jgi:hypothetical protein
MTLVAVKVQELNHQRYPKSIVLRKGVQRCAEHGGI